MRMTFLRYLDKVRGLLTKGYKVHSTEGPIELTNPKGELVAPLEAVYEETTGKSWDDETSRHAMRALHITPALFDRISEAELDLDTQWPRYRQAIEEALGIRHVA